jgi:hypothetical protein
MDATGIPGQLPATITRPRPLIEAVMAQSLREQGPGSRTGAAWRWALTGQGPAPVSDTPGTGQPPGLDEITAEARYGDGTLWKRWPPWRNAFDHDPDRQQARRVLRWVTRAADAIPLLDLDRGRYVGARLYFARTDDELRQVRGWARHGIAQHGDLPADIPRWQAERPWQWPTSWFDAAWLRGTIAYLDWILGDTQVAPVSGQPKPIASGPHPDPRVVVGQREMYGVAAGRYDIEEEVNHAKWGSTQGHEDEEPANPDEYPPPQWCEGVVQAHEWATGEDGEPPADHHGCGAYYPCPGDRRCSCEAAGHCLRGQCPACTDRVCNAGWTVIVENY